MKARSRAAHDGFTLVELVVALTVAGFALLIGRASLETTTLAGERQGAYASLTDREANGERLLRDLVAQIEVSAADSLYVRGGEWSAAFTSWCAAPGGWEERCSVRLQAYPGADTMRVWLGDDSLTLRLGREVQGLRYLESAAGGGAWLRGWDAPLNPPPAMAVVGASDTLIFAVGDRG